MSVTPTARQTVLEEVFDEYSKPSFEEIREYGLRIGIDIEDEPQLFDLAREGLMQPLPAEWRPVRDDDTDQIYYFNFKTKLSQWEHPLDAHYRNLVRKFKAGNSSQTDHLDEDSRTSLKEDLKSFEEASSIKQSSEMQATPLPPRGGKLEPLSGLVKKVPALTSPSSTEVKKRPNSSDIRNRRNIGPMEFRHLSKQDIMKTIKPDDRSKDEGYGTEFSFSSAGVKDLAQSKKELTLTGGGSMFLKNKTRSSPSTEITSPSLSDPLETRRSSQDDSQRRGILRDQKISPSAVKRIDITDEEKRVLQQEDLDDDRKSVRFNLEKELKIKFEIPNITSSDTEDESENEVNNDEDALVAHQADLKQIEIDFEDLEMRLTKPEMQSSHKAIRDMFEESTKPKTPVKLSSQKESKSSLNIVLNACKNYEASQKKIDKNLIDLSEDSSTTPRSDSNVQKMKMHFESTDLSAKKKLFETGVKRSVVKEQTIEQLLKLDEDVDRILESEFDMKLLSEDSKEDVVVKKKDLNRLTFEASNSLQDLEKDMNEKKLKKQKELEENFEIWSQEFEDSYSKHKEEFMKEMDEKYCKWKMKKEEEVMSKYKDDYEKESEARMNKTREDVKNELFLKETNEIEKLKKELEEEQAERLKKLKLEIELQEQTELAAIRKTFEDDLSKKKEELMKRHKEELIRIEKNLEDVLSEQRCQKILELDIARENEAAIEVMRLEMKENYQKQKNNLTKEHETLLENLRQQHTMTIEQIKLDFKVQEEALRKSHVNRLEELKARLNKDVDRKMENGDHTSRSDMSDSRVYEKVRCEKRLLEDKYKTLKEKYIRLKSDVKLSLEKKNKKKEAALGTTTGSETEKSSSYKVNIRKYDDDKRLQQHKMKKNLDNVTKNSQSQLSPSRDRKEERQRELKEGDTTSSEEGKGVRKRRQLFSKLKAASTSRLNGTNTSHDKDDSLSPVESLRRQLKKLEEIEDQFPVATHTDTYMRYPFTESTHFGSSELEFFRHRIHLERDSVRRAKEFLKAQKKCFENRQRELKQRLSEGGPRVRGVLEQIYQEEKELTDMEVSVHRTRSLLGEKIIRLRHLEHSLKRLSRGRSRSRDKEDGTLSDLSSHSGSSGFSSTDFNNSDGHNVTANRTSSEQNRRRFENNMQESSEIIHSLENLNLEIKEIWEVLKKQHQSGQGGTAVLPPPPLAYSDLGWLAPQQSPYRNTIITPTSGMHRPLAQQYATQVTAGNHLGHVTTTVVDSSLAERTKSLRNWLRAARNNGNTSDLLAGTNQVTL